MTSSAVCDVRHATCAELSIPLSSATDPAQVGGKAANLARLIALGVDVPHGEVLTTDAFARWLACDGLADRIAREDDAARIAEMVQMSRLSKDVAAAIDQVGARMLADGPLVVRSSAVGEDGASASFAGQFDSILHVTTAAELHAAIRRCWASYWGARATFYRRARGIASAGMGVIVQRQVPAVHAGVLFTQAPDGAPGEMLIEGCDGLADGLVSGRVEPWTVRANLTPGVISEAIPADITAGVMFALARIAGSIESALGAPQDIEWAIDADGRVWIVQTRPITAAPAPCAVRHASCVVWSNANVSENFPEPISPLLYSIASTGYYHYFRNLGLAFGVSRARLKAMDQPLRAIIGVHGARMYYNLTNIHAVLRLAPYGEALAASFNEFVGADEVAAHPPDAPQWRDRRGRVSQMLELARIAAATSWQYLFLRQRIETFEHDADTFASRTRPADLDSRSLADLNRDLLAFMEIRQHRWKNASLADAAAMVCYSLLQRVLAWCGAPPASHNRLLRALPGVPSGQPPLRLWALSRQIRSDATLWSLFERESPASILAAVRSDDQFADFRAEFERYLTDWGFRSSAELMLTSPTLEEAPLPALDLLKQYVGSDSEAPMVTMTRQAAERRAETRRLWRSLIWRAPHKAVAAVATLRAAQRAIAFRERARLKQALLYTRCRHIARAIGRRLVERGSLQRQDDIFFLRWQEIDEFATGRAMFAGSTADVIATRATEHARLSATAPPDRFVLPDGDVWTADDATTPAAAVVSLDRTRATTLRGTSACGGRVTAPAAVLADINEAQLLSAGDVLVTRQTDPGWGPVFCLVRGLVIERGGMLSHGAIIAREFGLPCVVGIKHATQLIAHGDRVTVDGDAGICVVEPRAACLGGAA